MINVCDMNLHLAKETVPYTLHICKRVQRVSLSSGGQSKLHNQWRLLPTVHNVYSSGTAQDIETYEISDSSTRDGTLELLCQIHTHRCLACKAVMIN